MSPQVFVSERAVRSLIARLNQSGKDSHSSEKSEREDVKAAKEDNAAKTQDLDLPDELCFFQLGQI